MFIISRFFSKAGPKIEPLASPDEYPIFSSNEYVYEYYRDNFLNDRQKEVYDNFVEAVLQFEPNFSANVDKLTSDELKQIYRFVVADHPELFWLRSYRAFDVCNHVFTSRAINIEYRYTKEEAIEKNEKMKLTYEPIIQEASKLKTDKEKVDYVRSKLMEIATYTSVHEREAAQDYYSMNSIFEYGKSMCGGYAYGFKFIMDRVGVTAINVLHLEEQASESHIWNMVLLNGIWYNMDISYDDVLRDKYNLTEDKYYLVEDNDVFYTDHELNEYLPNI